MCGLHYQRWRSHGTTESVIDENAKLSIRELMVRLFLSGITKLDNGCWLCTTAYPAKGGYARLQIRRGNVVHREQVHRVSYEHFNGKIPKDMLVCHSCDHRPCCNPAHLFCGTHADNTQDMVRKQRGLVGELNMLARLTEADVLSIYKAHDAGKAMAAIAKKLGVHPTTVSHVVIGRTWKHLFRRHRRRAPV